MPSPEGAGEGRFVGHIDRFVVYLENDTIIEQVVVAAGRCRVPQYPPLHDARKKKKKASNFAFLELNGDLWYPYMILMRTLPCSIDFKAA